MKKIFGLSLALLLSVGLVTGCGKKAEKKDDGKTNTPEEEQIKVNTNEDVVKDQQLEVFKFENTSLVYENGTSTLEATVTNTGSETATLAEFKIHVMNGEEEIVTLPGYIGSTLEANESKIITSTYGSDLTKATSITYEIVR